MSGIRLSLKEGYLAPILFRPYRKVYPISPLLVPLNEEFIKVALGAISDIDKGKTGHSTVDVIGFRGESATVLQCCS